VLSVITQLDSQEHLLCSSGFNLTFQESSEVYHLRWERLGVQAWIM